MTQNETQEFRALASGLVGLLGRRRHGGVRRIIAPAAPAAAGAPPAPPPVPPAPPEAKQPDGYTPPQARATAPAATSPGTAVPVAAPKPTAPALNLAGIQSPEELARSASACQACGLARHRNRVAVGAGSGSSGVLFLDEAPDAATDSTGDPFRSPGGVLLASIITKGMGLQLTDVHVAYLTKCLPPAGRPPEAEELAACRAWLDRQVELLDPKVIVTLGRPAASAFLGIEAPLGRLRGQLHDHGHRKVVATYHPDYLVRSPQDKKKAWEDIQLAMQAAGIPVPGRK